MKLTALALTVVCALGMTTAAQAETPSRLRFLAVNELGRCLERNQRHAEPPGHSKYCR
jgi:hypothetical protein